MLTRRYQVPKRRVIARVHTREAAPEEIVLFLAEQAETHAGAERPSDLLNGREEFLVVESAGRIVFLNRCAIERVSVPIADEVPPSDGDIAGLVDCAATDVPVEVVLLGGDRIEGIARYELPEANRRIQDFLNGDERFLELRLEDRVELVNKRHVMRVVQHQR